MIRAVPRTNATAHVSREAPRPTCSRGPLNARGHVAQARHLIGQGAWRLRSCAVTRAGRPRPAAAGGGGGAGGRDDVTGWKGGARAGAKGARAAVSVLAPPARQPGRRAHVASRWRLGSARIPCNIQDVKRGRAGGAQPSQPPGKGGAKIPSYPKIAGAPAGVSEAAAWAARRLCAGEACTAIVLGGRSAAAGCMPSRCAGPAASEQCPRGPGRAGATGGLRGRGGGLRRGGEGAGLGSPGARRWKQPSAAGCTAPGCGRGGTCVCGGGAGPLGTGEGPRAGPEGRGRCAGGWGCGCAGAPEWRPAWDG